MIGCPTNVDAALWKQLVDKVGDSNAFKMYAWGKETEQGVRDALKKIERPNSEKMRSVHINSEKVTPPKDSNDHTYYRRGYEKDPNHKIPSVSEILDRLEDLKYREDDVGRRYADSGTKLHKVFELYVDSTYGKVGEENLKKYMSDNGIPESFLATVKGIINPLKANGDIMVETALADIENGIAGTIDILHLKNDGTVDIYDIKTAHRTPNKAKNNSPIWNPLKDYGGYKARRYPTQVEFYSALTEKAIEQPISNRYIIPIEVSYKNDTVEEGISDLTSKPIENVKDYQNDIYAAHMVDRFLKRSTVSRPSLVDVDDSTEFMSKITGKIETRDKDYRATVNKVFEQKDNFNTKFGKKQYWNGKEFVTFRSTDIEKQKEEYIEEVLKKSEKMKRNIIPAIMNYLQTGESIYLSDRDWNSESIKAALEIYKGRDVQIYDLNEVKGFGNKQNWIVIQDGDNFDLIYYGNENLKDPIRVKNRGTLFGQYMTSRDAKYRLKSDLKDNIRDAKKLEATLIAMKMKESLPKATFHRILIHSTNQHMPVNVHLGEYLGVVKALRDNAQMRDLLPNNMKKIIANDKYFDSTNYRMNFAQKYLDHLKISDKLHDSKIVKQTQEFIEKKMSLEDFQKILAEEHRRLYEKLGTEREKNMEYQYLTQLAMQLRGIEPEIRPANVINKLLSLPQNVNNTVIHDIVSTVTTHIRRFTRDYWERYKTPMDKYFKDLYRSSGFGSKLETITFNETTSIFESILQKETYTVAGTNEQRTVSKFEFFKEGSDKFKTLSKEQQDFIVKANDAIMEAAERMNIKWVRGRIPLVKASVISSVITDVRNDDFSMAKYRDAFKQKLGDNFWFGEDLAPTQKEEWIETRFKNQENGETYDNRMALLGINEKYYDPDKYNGYERNLETAIDLFVMDSYRYKHLGDAAWIINAGQSFLKFYESNFFETEMNHSVDWLELWRDGMLHNRDHVPDKTSAEFMKAVKIGNRIGSYVTIGFKPSTAIVAYMGQQFSAFSQSVANAFSQNGAFTVKDFFSAQAKIMNPMNHEKISLLLDQYGFFDMDINALNSSQRKTLAKSPFQARYAYGPLRVGDWASRGQAMIAQMIHDGTWDAHTVKDGKLVYNEDADTRFATPEGKRLREAIIRELNEEGLMEGNRMTRAYGYNLRNKYKAQQDSIFGGFDKESWALYNYTWYGKLLGLFRKWLPSRLDRMFGGERMDKMAYGSYKVIVDEETGAETMVWDGNMAEGIMHTMGALYYNVTEKLKGHDTIPLTQIQKDNLMRLMSDVMIIGTITLVGTMMGEAADDDDDPGLAASATLLQRALQDLTSMYNIVGIATGLFAVPIPLQYMQKVLKSSYNITFGLPEGSTVLDEVVRITPFRFEYNLLSEMTE